MLAADANNFAVWQDHLKRSDVIHGNAVRQSVRAAGILCDITPNRA